MRGKALSCASNEGSLLGLNWLPESKEDTGDDDVNAPLVLNEFVLNDDDLELPLLALLLLLTATGGVD
jgi:hypothetical protein